MVTKPVMTTSGAALLLIVGALSGRLGAQTPLPSAPANVRIYAGAPAVPNATITIAPAAPTLTAGESLQFTATVAGTSNMSVVWTATGGTMTATGRFTAGQAGGTYAVTARLNGGTIARTIPVTVTTGAATPPEAGSLVLTDSGPVTTTRNGQVITGLRITSSSGPGLTIRHADVIVRNVEIRHRGGHGIDALNASRLRLEDVNVLHTGAPAAGPNPNDELNNVNIMFSPDVVVTRVRVTRGSAGFYVLESPRARLRWIECHDARGPFPRGQCVQFNKSHESLLEDFSYTGAAGRSWEEDNISVYQSSHVTVRRGLIDGNNSSSGVGVMFEQDDGASTGGLAEDVDTVRMGNGAFSAFPGRNVTFRRTRTRDNICTSQDGRGAPLSNGLAWAGEPTRSSGLRIEQSHYFALCNPTNLVWEDDVFTVIELASTNFTPHAPVRLVFPWE